jgi:hypothetical protein
LVVWTNDLVLRGALSGMAVLPVVVKIVAYFVFMVWDQDRLQAEEYRLRQRALKMIYRRGANPKVLDAARKIARMERDAGPQDEGDIS